MSGDTLWSIAARSFGQGALWPAIAGANPSIVDPNLIFVGETLIVPDAPSDPLPPADPKPATSALKTVTKTPTSTSAVVRHSAAAAAPVTSAVVRHSAAAAAPVSSNSLGGVWACIRAHESGGNYATNTGNGYYGAYQFSLSTWQSLGGGGLPSSAAPSVQDAMAQKLQAQSGWGQWPATSRMCGVR